MSDYADLSVYKAGRRRARELAMQVLFELELTDHTAEEAAMAHLATSTLATAHAEFARSLIVGTWEHKDALDERIAAAAPHWPLAQLPIVERTILRLAIFETCFDNRTPLRVAINEAVELAKAYGGEHSAKFVNGVLGSVASDMPGEGQGNGDTHHV